MRITYLTLAAAAAALSVGACNSPADKAAENHADALENQAAQADATGNEVQADQLNAQADKVEQDAGKKD